MTDWIEIKDDKDIEEFLELYGAFHDGCLREVHIVTRESVDKNFSMSFDGQLTATLLFQRQNKNLPVIELRFDNVDRFNYNPLELGYYAIIFDATFIKTDGLFYWADEDNWKIGDNEAVWISGERVYWRARPELVGQVNRMSGA